MSLLTIKRAVSADSEVSSPNMIEFVNTSIELNIELTQPQKNSLTGNSVQKSETNFAMQSFVVTQNSVFSLERAQNTNGPNQQKLPFEPNSEMRRLTNYTGLSSDLDRIFKSMRINDKLKLAIRLEEKENNRLYLALLVNPDISGSVIIGYTFVNESEHAQISMVIPAKNIENILLLGDGGFMINAYGERGRTFYPKSIKCLWNTVQLLYEVLEKIPFMKKRQQKEHEYRYYYDKLSTDPFILSLWNKSPSLASIVKVHHKEEIKNDLIHKKITSLIQDVMNEQNINTITMRQIKQYLKQHINVPLTEYSSYIDDEVMRICGQMDQCSKITDFLYLGSEWNASDIYSLEKNGIKAILNATVEVDNFFPGHFDYCNISVYDVPESDLMSFFDSSYRFIENYRLNSESVLVHCQMGKSRSATIVISYLMKHFNWSRELAQHFVKSKRPIIDPNSGFISQLDEYDGILNSSRNRKIFSPVRSVTTISPEFSNDINTRKKDIHLEHNIDVIKRIRSYTELIKK